VQEKAQVSRPSGVVAPDALPGLPGDSTVQVLSDRSLAGHFVLIVVVVVVVVVVVLEAAVVAVSERP
jgi:hypothetical protein